MVAYQACNCLGVVAVSACGALGNFWDEFRVAVLLASLSASQESETHLGKTLQRPVGCLD